MKKDISELRELCLQAHVDLLLLTAATAKSIAILDQEYPSLLDSLIEALDSQKSMPKIMDSLVEQHGPGVRESPVEKIYNSSFRRLQDTLSQFLIPDSKHCSGK